jgi:hypothetical protein
LIVKSTVRMRFWVESGLALLSGLLAFLTSLWPDWLEALTGFDPDARSGSFEWMIVGALALAAVLLALTARSEWRRSRLAAIGAA